VVKKLIKCLTFSTEEKEEEQVAVRRKCHSVLSFLIVICRFIQSLSDSDEFCAKRVQRCFTAGTVYIYGAGLLHFTADAECTAES